MNKLKSFYNNHEKEILILLTFLFFIYIFFNRDINKTNIENKKTIIDTVYIEKNKKIIDSTYKEKFKKLNINYKKIKEKNEKLTMEIKNKNNINTSNDSGCIEISYKDFNIKNCGKNIKMNYIINEIKNIVNEKNTSIKNEYLSLKKEYNKLDSIYKNEISNKKIESHKKDSLYIKNKITKNKKRIRLYIEPNVYTNKNIYINSGINYKLNDIIHISSGLGVNSKIQNIDTYTFHSFLKLNIGLDL